MTILNETNEARGGRWTAPGWFCTALVTLILAACNSPDALSGTPPGILTASAPTHVSGQPTGNPIQPPPLPSEAATTPESAQDFVPATRYAALHTEVETVVELFYYERWMRVDQRVEITNSTSDVWDEMVFNAIANTVEDSFYLDFVTLTRQGDGSPTDVQPVFTDLSMLHVPLPTPLNPGESATVRFQYRVLIPPVAPTDWPPVGNTGWTLDLIQAGEWYPALVPYIEGQGWHTWRYHPVGDPAFYTLSDHRLRITTEPGIVIASGGLVQHEGNTWEFYVERARGVAFYASDHYEVTEGEVDGIPVRSYYLRADSHAGINAYGAASDALRLFIELFGPYPYDSLTVVENGFFGGMEYSGLISVTDYAYYTYNGRPDSLLHILIAHEVAHQWWYGAVGNDQINEAWLDESLAFYSELLYIERYAPDQTGWWWEVRVDRFDPQGPVNASPYDYANAPSFILWMYGQAARFIRDLRGTLGDEAFFAFLRDYYATYQWQIVTGTEFLAMAQQYTDRDLGQLIARYFETAVEDEAAEDLP